MILRRSLIEYGRGGSELVLSSLVCRWVMLRDYYGGPVDDSEAQFDYVLPVRKGALVCYVV